jgi:hypothetical protein
MSLSPGSAFLYRSKRLYENTSFGGTSHETNSLCVLNKPGSGSTFELEFLSALQRNGDLTDPRVFFDMATRRCVFAESHQEPIDL